MILTRNSIEQQIERVECYQKAINRLGQNNLSQGAPQIGFYCFRVHLANKIGLLITKKAYANHERQSVKNFVNSNP